MNPYRKSNRLADVLAAIQIMGLYDHHRLAACGWAGVISGDESKADHWRLVFDEHPEFFRPSAHSDHVGHYSLLWRRALPERLDRESNKVLSESEFNALTKEQ